MGKYFLSVLKFSNILFNVIPDGILKLISCFIKSFFRSRGSEHTGVTRVDQRINQILSLLNLCE